MLNDPLANALSIILNSEKIRKTDCLIKPISNLIKSVLDIMRDHHFRGSFKEIEDGRGNANRINLLGALNKCGAIKPRYSVEMSEYEKFEKRYLPAKDFGIIIVSTSSGILTHKEARKKGIGGRLLAYCY